jgi:multidrug efflux pump subunit AcrA (membrane-fusion protein)
MEKVRAAGARLALFDCPDRIAGRHLLRDERDAEAKGILTLEQIATLEQRSKELGLKLMWSGAITARQAFSLGALGVFAIFSTGATSRRVAVHGSFTDDPELASEGEPTEIGVRRVHAAIQAGFLSTALRDRDKQLAEQVRDRSLRLLQTIDAQSPTEEALAQLDEALLRGWRQHWAGKKPA